MAIYRSTELKSVKTHRIATNIHELDYLYGYSDDGWGLPSGKITLLTGSSGVGKTRLLIELVKKMVSYGQNIIFMQGELGIAQFVTEKMGGFTASNFHLTDDIGLDEQINYIEALKPILMIIDSAQQLEDWKRGRGAKAIIRRYRDAIEKTGTHIILVSQMNRDGTSKGGTEIGHEVDIELFADKTMPGIDGIDGVFYVQSGKNRYGKSDITTIWRHDDKGVSCISDIRFHDPKYMKNRNSNDHDPVPPGTSDKDKAKIKTWEDGLSDRMDAYLAGPKPSLWARIFGFG